MSISVPTGDPHAALAALVAQLNAALATLDGRLAALEDAATAAKAFPYPPKEEEAKDKS